MKIGVLTSSRADYGIYLPLLKKIKEDNFFELEIIAFGTHLSISHGFTLNEIENGNYSKIHCISSLIANDDEQAVATSYALTALKFADFWQYNKFDLVFCLGDRFEMSAAVQAGIPFNVKFAHLHGGETTLGAIDNIYRHCISLASKYHFVSAQPFMQRLKELVQPNDEHIYTVGSLSLENIQYIKLLTPEAFYQKWGINLNQHTILITVHPETVAFDKNELFCKEILHALSDLSNSFQLVITMPNADTAGLIYRQAFMALAEQKDNVKLIENFGTQSYFTCMKYAKLLIGNTSSGILEAASFNKYVLNLGDRQKGRLCSSNVVHLPFDSNEIIAKTNEYVNSIYQGENIYFQQNVFFVIFHNCIYNHTLNLVLLRDLNRILGYK
jgi:GDP/UDP-N,N'-diacetylbacillosamine 2-epimerase (hydrolysing)